MRHEHGFSDGLHVWERRARRWASDPVVRTLLNSQPVSNREPLRPAANRRLGRWVVAASALAGVILVGWAASRERVDQAGSPVAVSSSVVGDALPRRDPQLGANPEDVNRTRRHAIGIALGGNTDSLAVLLTETGIDSTHWSAQAVTGASRVMARAGRIHYSAARRAIAHDDHALATQHLRRAILYGRGSYLEDDALYLLMTMEVRSGDLTAARLTASRLLERHPESIFANSHARRLVSDTTASAGR